MHIYLIINKWLAGPSGYWSHMVFFGIERESACWKKAACLNHIGCGDGSFHCDDHLGDYKFLNDLCSTKTQNSTNFNSGIFLEALQSGILKKKDFVHKLYYCLRWGLQSVRSVHIRCFHWYVPRYFLMFNFFIQLMYASNPSCSHIYTTCFTSVNSSFWAYWTYNFWD